MPAGTATKSFDALVAEFVLAATSLPRHQKRRVLREELRALPFMATAADPEPARRTVLVGALQRIACEPDAARLRRAAEELTVTTDLDTLYHLIDPGCVLTLSFEGRRDGVCRVGVDEVVAELCDEQESILGCRGDLAGRRSTGGRRGSTSSVVVRGVSEVKSWCRPQAAGEPPSPQVGTQVTFYADPEQAEEVFTLHTVYTFTVDGRRVESIARTLVSHDTYNANGVLREVHFGTFGTEVTGPRT